jgi:integrase
MTVIKLKYVQAFTARGQRFYYFRRPGSPRLRLPGIPGSAEFMKAYEAALVDLPRVEIGASRTKSGTVNDLIVRYYGSAEFTHALSPATQNYRRNILERFREPRGDRPVNLIEQRHIAGILEQIKKPHARKSWLKAIRGLMKYAVQISMIARDPTADIKLVKLPKSEGHKTWGESEVEAFRAKHPLGTRPRLALELLLNTVQRRGDVVRMGRQHIRNGEIYVKQRKTGVELSLPVLPELVTAIAAMPSDHLTFLTTISGKPFSDAGFGNWFRECCDEAGLKGYSAHGLRKAGCVRLAEAGCSANVIASWSGHLTLAEVARYTRAADQKRLARSALDKLATPDCQTAGPSLSNEETSN